MALIPGARGIHLLAFSVPLKFTTCLEIVDVNFRMKATLCKNKNGYGNKYSLVLTLLLSLLSDSYERTVMTGRRVSQFGEMSMTSEMGTVEQGTFWGFLGRILGRITFMFNEGDSVFSDLVYLFDRFFFLPLSVWVTYLLVVDTKKY